MTIGHTDYGDVDDHEDVDDHADDDNENGGDDQIYVRRLCHVYCWRGGAYFVGGELKMACRALRWNRNWKIGIKLPQRSHKALRQYTVGNGQL